jgi:CRISPR/Cas system CMR-associated protein Cmr5 small subunit
MENRKQIIQLSEKSSDSLLVNNYLSNKIKTVDQARKAKVPTLAAMSRTVEDGRAFGKEEVVRQIVKWLIELNEMMDLNKPMTNAQILMTAQMIMEDYYYLKSTDLALFFTRIIKGEFGEMYESLSITKIMSWLAIYSEERMNIGAQEARMKHDKIISKETDVPRYLNK